jgi:hypothetical protein
MTHFAAASITEIDLDFIYDDIARERAAIEDEMMLRDSAEAEYELDRADFDTFGRYTRNPTASYSV